MSTINRPARIQGDGTGEGTGAFGSEIPAAGRTTTGAASDSARLLRGSPGKLYLHVANLMRRRLETGMWAPGQQLPTLTTLAAELGVANVTVRQAVAILEHEGLLRRQQGRGTFVTEHPAARTTFAVGLDWPSLLDMVTKSTPRLIRSAEAVQPPPAAPDDGTLAPAYRFLKRVNSVDSVPCLVADAYVDARVFARAPERFEAETLITVLGSLPGVGIARCRQVLTIGQADLETAHLLGIPVSAPLGEVRRIITDPDGVIIYYNTVAYRGDLVRFEIDLHPGQDRSDRPDG